MPRKQTSSLIGAAKTISRIWTGSGPEAFGDVLLFGFADDRTT